MKSAPLKTNTSRIKLHVSLKRSGFSSLAPDRPVNPEVAARTLARFPFVYQKGADAARPAWALRHGTEAPE